jgi:hypothetical protein
MPDLYAYILDAPVAIAQDIAGNLVRQVELYEEEKHELAKLKRDLANTIENEVAGDAERLSHAELLAVAAKMDASREARNASIE